MNETQLVYEQMKCEIQNLKEENKRQNVKLKLINL